MRAAGCTDVRCHALSDEEVHASGCLYMTYRISWVHDEIIRGPSCKEYCWQSILKASHFVFCFALLCFSNLKHFPYRAHNLPRLLMFFLLVWITFKVFVEIPRKGFIKLTELFSFILTLHSQANGISKRGKKGNYSVGELCIWIFFLLYKICFFLIWIECVFNGKHLFFMAAW